MTQLNPEIDSSWKAILHEEFNKDYFKKYNNMHGKGGVGKSTIAAGAIASFSSKGL